MATISSNANSTHSPRHSSDQSRRATRTTSVSSPSSSSSSSPWTQIVRGESDLIVAAAPIEPPQVAASPPPEDEGTESNAGKRHVWNKPSNGAVEIGPVMGAHLWPALSDGARASSNKSISDGSSSSPVSGSQGSGTVTSSSQKQVSNNANTNSTLNHPIPSRQRPMKRNSNANANSSFNGGLSHPPAPQGPVVEGPTNNPSPRDHTQRTERSGSVSQSHGGSDHPQQRNSYKNRNGGQHSRGDGSHHHNYGGRRDQDRGNQDWNNNRNFNVRDAHVQQQRVVPRFMRHTPPPPPPTSTPFIAPPPIRPFGGPMGYTELPSPMYYVAAPPPESLRGMPFVAPIPHAMFLPAPDPQLHSRIVIQIDYYFSNENLIKDTYLRQNMDDQGWVPIKLIAGFKKVLNLTDNIQLILDALRSSTVVEVQGDKVRKRNDWMRWVMPSVQLPNVSATQAQGNSSHDMLAARVQNISLEQNTTDHNSARSQAEAFLSRSSSGDLNDQSPLSSSEGMGQVSSQGSSNRSILARSSN